MTHPNGSSNNSNNANQSTDTNRSNSTDTNSDKTKRFEPQAGFEWGYDLYPERRSAANSSGFKALLEGKGRENLDKIRCERNVYKCIKRSPLVRLMMGALKRSGCAIDIRRHIACEECSPRVTGGYDPVLNQVVICQNTARNEGYIQGVLTHEMIHMFDYCRNHLDFKNLDHLACTEIRAANLAHCSFLTALGQGDISVFDIKGSHQYCVKNKALTSILAVREVTQKEAIDAINRVFPKCYSDLEPIGRRLRRNSDDMYRAYKEGAYYGYDEI